MLADTIRFSRREQKSRAFPDRDLQVPIGLENGRGPADFVAGEAAVLGSWPRRPSTRSDTLALERARRLNQAPCGPFVEGPAGTSGWLFFIPSRRALMSVTLAGGPPSAERSPSAMTSADMDISGES